MGDGLYVFRVMYTGKVETLLEESFCEYILKVVLWEFNHTPP